MVAALLPARNRAAPLPPGSAFVGASQRHSPIIRLPPTLCTPQHERPAVMSNKRKAWGYDERDEPRRCPTIFWRASGAARAPFELTNSFNQGTTPRIYYPQLHFARRWRGDATAAYL